MNTEHDSYKKVKNCEAYLHFRLFLGCITGLSAVTKRDNFLCGGSEHCIALLNF